MEEWIAANQDETYRCDICGAKLTPGAPVWTRRRTGAKYCINHGHKHYRPREWWAEHRPEMLDAYE